MKADELAQRVIRRLSQPELYPRTWREWVEQMRAAQENNVNQQSDQDLSPLARQTNSPTDHESDDSR